jgi:AcrR family transcriptional regulator
VTTRTGRRPGGGDTRADILAAARASFADKGYDGTSLRSVARAAGVDPALVHRFFDGKPGLFAAAMDLPADPGTLVRGMLDAGLDGLGERIVRTFLGVWDSPPAQERLVALLRAGVSGAEAGAVLRGFLTEAVLEPVAEATGRADGRLRASLVGSQLVGLAVARYVLRLEPLASAAPQAFTSAVAPTLPRYHPAT